MFYGGGFYGGRGGRGRRDMYHLTGLPGWMRGMSPGGPCAQYLLTGQWPTPPQARKGETRMKIAVAAAGNTLDAPVDPRFGRCAWFVIVDSETMAFEAVENPGAMAGGGAGIQAAQVVASKGAQAVVAGNMGPNAHQALSAAGIQILPFAGGTVRQAVEAVKSGQLTAATAPTVPLHFGTGGAAPTPSATGPGSGVGFGSGSGRGGGGRGRGRGFRGGR